MVQKYDTYHDIMYSDCPRFIHSNSTSCWLMSFCSRAKKERYIPQTRFYDGQKLGIIERDDKIYQVSPI